MKIAVAGVGYVGLSLAVLLAKKHEVTAVSTTPHKVDLINSGRIRLEPLITHRFPVEQLEDAILMQMSDESIKVIVGGQ